MNFNRQRHKVLKLLSISRIQFDSGRRNADFKLGVSFDDLQKELNCDLDTCELIYSTLYNENEVEYTNTAVIGLISTQKGLKSYSDKKYLIENEKIIIDYIKNFVQIVIPILSLVIAILSIQLRIDTSNDKINKKIENLEIQLTKQEHIINDLRYNLQNKKSNSD